MIANGLLDVILATPAVHVVSMIGGTVRLSTGWLSDYDRQDAS